MLEVCVDDRCLVFFMVGKVDKAFPFLCSQKRKFGFK